MALALDEEVLQHSRINPMAIKRSMALPHNMEWLERWEMGEREEIYRTERDLQNLGSLQA